MIYLCAYICSCVYGSRGPPLPTPFFPSTVRLICMKNHHQNLLLRLQSVYASCLYTVVRPPLLYDGVGGITLFPSFTARMAGSVCARPGRLPISMHSIRIRSGLAQYDE